jgi:hypothetical protein
MSALLTGTRRGLISGEGGLHDSGFKVSQKRAMMSASIWSVFVRVRFGQRFAGMELRRSQEGILQLPIN